MFSKILIANRGEVGVRIIKTCRRLGIKTAIVYSEADADSLAVEMADEAIFIGPAPAAQSYLVIDKIVDAAKKVGAEAIHPGFGFLSERAEFAERLLKEKITFIGPNPHAISAMGDKIESKRAAGLAGVNTVPGYVGEIAGVDHALQISNEIGYPVMIKASAGGGGKGIRIAWNDADVREGLPATQAEAKASFGDDRIFIEKFVTEPHHIEIQIIGDKHGNVIHLNERECSIQRRNQKVVEEAPSPFLDAKTRAAMGAQAVALAKAVNYDSAGTVEFIVDGKKNFYFLEMNTRLQVEHPITEMITGVDLVELMMRSAAGEKLPLKQEDVKINGWAIETRLYAEDPYRNFLPSIGRLKRYKPPVEGKFGEVTVRNDSGVREGDEISVFYDPMIAKLITHAPKRIGAIDAQAKALDSFLIEGIRDNAPFLNAVMAEPNFRAGKYTTAYIKETYPEGFKGAPVSPDQQERFIAVAGFAHSLLDRRAREIEGQMNGRRSPRREWAAVLNGESVKLFVDLTSDGADVSINGSKAQSLKATWSPGTRSVTGSYKGEEFEIHVYPTNPGYSLRQGGATVKILIMRPKSADMMARLPVRPPADTSKLIVSPMPGLVVSMDVEVGQTVSEGQTVAVIEAMKMQNILKAERDGVVKIVGAKSGDTVAADDVLVEFV
jgi:propionyl-CoA carboxylase alpha chain